MIMKKQAIKEVDNQKTKIIIINMIKKNKTKEITRR